MSYSQEQLALKAYIEANNQKIINENKGSFLILPTDDIDHWAESGVTTIEQYEHMSAVGTYVDVYKETYGIKPRWRDFDGVPAADVWKEVEVMLESARAEERERQEARAQRKAELAENNRYRPNNVFADILASR